MKNMESKYLIKNKYFLLEIIGIITIFLVSSIIPAASAANGSWDTRSSMTSKFLALKTRYPQYVDSDIIGKTFQGRPIYLLRIGKLSLPSTQSILITAELHGKEWVGTEVCYGILIWILTSSESAAVHLKTSHIIYVVFMVNVDSYKTLNQWNIRGVNLNRNFPTFWSANAGGFNCGSYPLSEPESVAVHDMFNLAPKWHLDLHLGGTELMLPRDAQDNIPELIFYKSVLGEYKSICTSRGVSVYYCSFGSGSATGGLAYLDSYWGHGCKSWLLEIYSDQSPSYSVLSGLIKKVIPLVMVMANSISRFST